MLRVLRSLALIALAELSLYAQLNVGGITGTVHDASGAVMPRPVAMKAAYFASMIGLTLAGFIGPLAMS